MAYKNTRGIILNRRDYEAGRMFVNGSPAYSYFPGGYFDGDGAPHYLHTDYQGSVVMVTDSAGNLEQHNSYYPYGEPHRLPQGQPQLYASKERIASTGEYNYGARRHYAPALNWTTPDPKAPDYNWLSPYSFCAANPVKYIDPTGEDIFILNYDGGKHLAMLIQNDEGKWQYYSINGNNMRLSGSHIGGREFNDVAVGEWDSPTDFLNSDYNQEDDAKDTKHDSNYNHFGYNEGYLIPTTKEQDGIMRVEFKKKSKTSYNFLSNNCAHAVQDVMIKAGLPVSPVIDYEPIYIPVSTEFGFFRNLE